MKRILSLAFISLLSLVGCNKQPAKPVEPEVVYTAESVAADISSELASYGISALSYDEDSDSYGKTLNFSEDGVDYSNTQAEEDVLYPVVATLASLMPDYLELVGAKYFTSEEDFWEDESGDTVYYALYSVSEVCVDLIGYCYLGYLLGQIAVYEA